MHKIIILLLIFPFTSYANDFFSDEIPNTKGSSAEIFNDKANTFDAEGELESVKRFRLNKELEKKKKAQQAFNKEMSSMCGCYFKLCLTSVRYSDPIYVQQSWRSESKCEDSYDDSMRYIRKLSGKQKRRQKREAKEERKNCISYVRKHKKRKKICYQWKEDQSKGVDNGSKYAQEIKALQGAISSQLKKEEVAKKERLKRDRAEDQLVIDEIKRKQEYAAESLKRKQEEALEKRYQSCVKKWSNKSNPCGCGGFGDRPIPAWVKNAKSCTR